LKFKLIIPASGSGSRFGSKIPKQFLKIESKEILTLTIEKFHSIKNIDEIIISSRKDFFKKIISIVDRNDFYKVSGIVEGGKTRHDSVYSALKILDCDKNDILIIHDAVRPFISREKILEMMNEAVRFNSVIPGIAVADTIKRTDKKNFVTETIDRNNLWSIQTPQFFRYEILIDAFEKANRKKFKGTDESMIVENAGYKVKIVEGEKGNIKITIKEDIKN
jgi:2-C-methyl-D-erythritol 4-phosphate cytidylyltransferase